MKTCLMLCVLAFGISMAIPAHAAMKTYQVTGEVLELTPDKIAIAKGSQKWEMARGGANIPDTVKVGQKVMINYTMTAASVTSKEKPAKTK